MTARAAGHERIVAITGAGSGIGRALATTLAERGARLALCDIDPAGLADTAQACTGADAVTTTALDVADRDAVFAWADQVVTDHGGVTMIVNNAGVALDATVDAPRHEDVRWLIDINLWGVVHGTTAFLPHLKAGGGGHVVNISSVFGLISVPRQSAYNASKFAVRGYTDALRLELDIERSPVSATTVHPGGIRTNIVRSARSDRPQFEGLDAERLLRTDPEKAAAQILRAVRRNRRRVLVGPDAKVIDLVSRLPAGLYQRMAVRGARRLEANGPAAGTTGFPHPDEHHISR